VVNAGPSPTVDLRSDTVTRPSAEMRRVIAEAEVGDAVLGDDPTVNELERYAAELLGKERALFFPSGIMANQAALLVQAEPGTEVVIEAGAHIVNFEEAAAAALGGLQLRPVTTSDGVLTTEHVREAIRPASPYLPRTGLICLENTHNSAGGRILPLAEVHRIVELAREHQLPVHLDGARLANAAVATGSHLRDFAQHADTVMVSLSKGLGAPVGSLLAGAAATMERAWRARRRLGGGMRQAGLLAAAGLFALQHNLDRLAHDHRRARELAHAAAHIKGLDATPPDTNIVMIELRDPRLSTDLMLAGLEAEGVWLTAFGPRRLRAVTHLDIDDAAIHRAIRALSDVAEGLASSFETDRSGQ
jgi:threonine aldolase